MDRHDFRVLIVDDDAMNIDILRDDLEEKYQVASAESGEEALEVIEAFRPDVILLDIMMTGIDGYEVCRRIRADPSNDGIRIILISGRAMDTERQKGFDVGADDYITKPFDVDMVEAKLHQLHQRKRDQKD
jgi:CheY-like chemotaxis protein